MRKRQRVSGGGSRLRLSGQWAAGQSGGGSQASQGKGEWQRDRGGGGGGRGGAGGGEVDVDGRRLDGEMRDTTTARLVHDSLFTLILTVLQNIRDDRTGHRLQYNRNRETKAISWEWWLGWARPRKVLKLRSWEAGRQQGRWELGVGSREFPDIPIPSAAAVIGGGR